MDKRKIFLVLLVVAAMIPLDYITKVFPFLRYGLSRFIRSEMAHIVGHLVLFGGLTILILVLFDLKLDVRSAVLIGLLVLDIGLGQEFMQLQVKGRGFDWPELFDLGVDLIGAVLGWLVYARLIPYGRYLRIAWFILSDVQARNKRT